MKEKEAEKFASALDMDVTFTLEKDINEDKEEFKAMKLKDEAD